MSRFGEVLLLVLLVSKAHGQAKPARMEILLEKEENGKGVVVEPGHVFESGDRVRFRFTPNFSGTLFVMNRGTSGSYTMLFPKEDTGTDDHIEAGHAYLLPATDRGWFRITGPEGHDVVYFVVNFGAGGDSITPVPVPHLPPSGQESPFTAKPRCNDAMFRARGDCIDLSAGPKAAGDSLPENLSGMRARDLFFIRENKTSVVSSAAPAGGPIVYEFHIAHK